MSCGFCCVLNIIWISFAVNSKSNSLFFYITINDPNVTGCLSHDCSTPLENKAVYEGTSTSFEREYNDEVVSWYIYPTYPTSAEYPFAMTITKDDGDLVEMFLDTYALNQCKLTIFNSTIGPQGSMPYSTAGIYHYVYKNWDCETAACLVVISKSIFSCIIWIYKLDNRKTESVDSVCQQIFF